MKLQFTEMEIPRETPEGRDGQVVDVASVKCEMPIGHPNSGGQVGGCIYKSGVQGRGLSRGQTFGSHQQRDGI